MENNFVGERLKKLPPGFRFKPTDEEIVFGYLKCKTLSLPLPASIIPDLHLSSLDPSDFPGGEERYFFTKKEANIGRESGSNYKETSSGYWKATGSKKHLSPPQRQQPLGMTGMKETFVFYRGKPNVCQTHWFMHEYSLRIDDSTLRRHNVTDQHNSEGTNSIQDWTICCVFSKNNYRDRLMATPNISHCGSSSSSSSNSITKISSNGVEFEEITSPN